MLYLEIGRLLQDFPGLPGIVIQEAQGDTVFEHNPKQIFPAASLIKLPILLEYFLLVQRDLLDSRQRIELKRDQIVEGSGILQVYTYACT